MNEVPSLDMRCPTYSTSSSWVHPTISDEELIKKKDLLDPLDDDDGIEWKANPFDACPLRHLKS